MFQADVYYKNHKYVVQNKTQELLDHMYPTPMRFNVAPKYHCGISNDEYCDGFNELWNVIRKIYTDIIATPEKYGLPLYEDYVRECGDSKWLDSSYSAYRLMDFFLLLYEVGELQGKILSIPLAELEKHLKTRTFEHQGGKKLTKTYVCQLIVCLMEFGFSFSGFNGKTFDKKINSFSVAYEENPNLISALKGYCLSDGDNFHCCQYHRVAYPEGIIQPGKFFAFIQCLRGEEKNFFIRFHERMIEEGFLCGSYGISYYMPKSNKEQPWLVRCDSHHNQLSMTLRQYKIAAYDEYLNTMPVHIIDAYKTSLCGNCHVIECHHRYCFEINGKYYGVCLYGGKGADITKFNINDIENYISLIKKEAMSKTPNAKVFKEKQGAYLLQPILQGQPYK